MIYINQDETNQVPVVCSRNNLSSGDVYLWSMTHKLTFQTWNFIPYRIPPTTTYKPGYDLFCITVDNSLPQTFTGNTSCSGSTSCNIHLIPGEYWVRIYSQSSNTNLNPDLSLELVYETMGLMVGTNQNDPITYSGNSDVFIVYNEDND
jgi:hypothetical protein